MTPQEENSLRIQAAKRGYNRQQVEAFVQFAKQKEQTQAPARAAEEPKTNPIKSLAKDAFNTLIVRPATRVGQALSYGIGAATGNEVVKEKALQDQSVDLGPLGQYNVASPKAGMEGVKQVAGEAAQSASYLYTPAKGVSIAKGTFGQTVLRTALESGKAGAIGGTLYSGGKAAEEGGNAAEIATEALKGGAAGAAAGALLGGAGAVAAKGASALKSQAQRTTQALRADDSFITRTGRRIQDAIDSRNELKAQPAAVQRAAKVDISPETSRFMISMSPQDKRMAKAMVSMAKDAKNTLKPTRRPVEVPGRAILEPVTYIQNARHKAGQNLGEVIRTMPSSTFTAENSVKVFKEGLGELGVTVGQGGKLNFAGSSITNTTEQTLLQRVANDLRLGKAKAGQLTPLQDHRTRQRIFGMLKTARAKGELTYGQNVAERVRDALKEDLVLHTGAAGKRYAEEARKYAQAEDTLKDFFTLLGKKWEDKGDELLSLRAGEVGSRILGNASAAPLEVIKRVEETAKILGFTPKHNPIDLLLVNDILEDIIGTTQTRSLRGQVSRGVRDAAGNLAGMAEDAVSGNKVGVVKKAYDFVRGITPEEQLRELLRLLE